MNLAIYGSGAELLGIKHNMHLICVCLKALGVLKDTLMRTWYYPLSLHTQN